MNRPRAGCHIVGHQAQMLWDAFQPLTWGIDQKKTEISHCVLNPATSLWTPSLALKYELWPCIKQISELNSMWSSGGVSSFILILKLQNCLRMLKSQAEKASAILGLSLKTIPEEGSRHIWEAIFRLLDLRKTLESWEGTRSVTGSDLWVKLGQEYKMANPRVAGVGTEDALTCTSPQGNHTL